MKGSSKSGQSSPPLSTQKEKPLKGILVNKSIDKLPHKPIIIDSQRSSMYAKKVLSESYSESIL